MSDEVTRLIIDTHDAQAFAPVSHLTVGGFRDWLLCDDADEAQPHCAGPRADAGDGRSGVEDHAHSGSGPGGAEDPCGHPLSQHPGLPGACPPACNTNHPTDDPAGIAASVVDGLLYGNGDA
ncbi:ethanolamine ammonia-lyase subunit EutB [Halopseudomonas pachastrellae]|nr:ethanolamine ammonia-lyase subunit EutB [Halopseudomonas pachastrellae]